MLVYKATFFFPVFPVSCPQKYRVGRSENVFIFFIFFFGKGQTGNTVYKQWYSIYLVLICVHLGKNLNGNVHFMSKNKEYTYIFILLSLFILPKSDREIHYLWFMLKNIIMSIKTLGSHEKNRVGRETGNTGIFFLA